MNKSVQSPASAQTNRFRFLLSYVTPNTQPHKMFEWGFDIKGLMPKQRIEYPIQTASKLEQIFATYLKQQALGLWDNLKHYKRKQHSLQYQIFDGDYLLATYSMNIANYPFDGETLSRMYFHGVWKNFNSAFKEATITNYGFCRDVQNYVSFTDEWDTFNNENAFYEGIRTTLQKSYTNK